jgi:hypothetical protein
MTLPVAEAPEELGLSPTALAEAFDYARGLVASGRVHGLAVAVRENL